jgi:hypothetical protein
MHATACSALSVITLCDIVALSSLFGRRTLSEYSAADRYEHRQKYQTGFVKKIWNTIPLGEQGLSRDDKLFQK